MRSDCLWISGAPWPIKGGKSDWSALTRGPSSQDAAGGRVLRAWQVGPQHPTPCSLTWPSNMLKLGSILFFWGGWGDNYGAQWRSGLAADSADERHGADGSYANGLFLSLVSDGRLVVLGPFGSAVFQTSASTYSPSPPLRVLIWQTLEGCCLFVEWL